MVSLLTALQAMDSHKFSVIPLAHSSQLLLRDYKVLHSCLGRESSAVVYSNYPDILRVQLLLHDSTTYLLS